MKIDRLDLDGLGSPAGIAAKIHELVDDMPHKVPLEQLCKLLDITSITEIDTDGFEAALVMDELKAAGAILLAAGRSEKRRRFSIGHELGHFLIPSHRPHPDHPFQCSLTDLHQLDPRARDRRRRIEAEANRFAAHLLMPPKLIRARMRQDAASLESIVALAQDLGVSKEAMARAWVDTHRDPVAVIIAQNGSIVRQYRSEEFPWLPTGIGHALPTGSVASSCRGLTGQFSDIEEIEPDVWVRDRDASKVLVLSEQVLAQRDGFAMILLLAELDEDED